MYSTVAFFSILGVFIVPCHSTTNCINSTIVHKFNHISSANRMLYFLSCSWDFIFRSVGRFFFFRFRGSSILNVNIHVIFGLNLLFRNSIDGDPGKHQNKQQSLCVLYSSFVLCFHWWTMPFFTFNGFAFNCNFIFRLMAKSEPSQLWY